MWLVRIFINLWTIVAFTLLKMIKNSIVKPVGRNKSRWEKPKSYKKKTQSKNNKSKTENPYKEADTTT